VAAKTMVLDSVLIPHTVHWMSFSLIIGSIRILETFLNKQRTINNTLTPVLAFNHSILIVSPIPIPAVDLSLLHSIHNSSSPPLVG
jgi:hypothetical protein